MSGVIRPRRASFRREALVLRRMAQAVEEIMHTADELGIIEQVNGLGLGQYVMRVLFEES